jgi:hypothetical protein
VLVFVDSGNVEAVYYILVGSQTFILKKSAARGWCFSFLSAVFEGDAEVWLFLVPVVVVIAVLVWIYWAQVIGAGWSPTPLRVVEEMLEMAGVDSTDMVYDLGSGDGRILVMAARVFGARVIGVEADPIRFLTCLLRLKLNRVRNARVIWGNFFRVDISHATVVTAFLSEGANQKLRDKFQRELSAGTRIVSYYWEFIGWTPVESNPASGVYLYRVP